MYIYNVTIKVDISIAGEWLLWMKNVHIPKVLSTGCFSKHQLVKLLEIDEEEGPTYAAQYFADNIEQYHRYIQHFSAELRKETIDKWGDKFIAFRSLMQVVD
jgi:hypothetical protein